MHDNVNTPLHYTSHPSGVEVIEITRSLLFCEGNMFKYVARADLKGDPVETFEKALKYNEFAEESEAGGLICGNERALTSFIAAEPDPVKATLFRLIGFQARTPERRDAIEYLIGMLIEDAEDVERKKLDAMLTGARKRPKPKVTKQRRS